MRFSRLLATLAVFLLTAAPAFAADKGIDARAKSSAGSSSATRRLALVIGNSAYRHSGTLANPARDAELMARTLRQVGFELHGGAAQTDLSRAALDQAIESFGNALRTGDVALFYYSGHGLQVGGENYLVPVDADIRKEAEVRVKTVPVNLLFAKLDGIPRAVNLVILDACRNNPFARTFRSSAGGLAAVNAPTGTLVAFSTGPGQVAEDGSGKNSTYTAALAKYIREPGLRVEDVFKRVRSSVSQATKGSQTPWENTSLTGDFAFIEGDALALKKAALAAAGEAKKDELDALLKMEAAAKRQQEKEQAEIARREAEVARMDAEIAAMKARLGAGTAGKNDNLHAMLAMVEQKEAQAAQLEALRRQREAEEAKRQAEIVRLKEEQKERRREKLEKDLAAYEKIANSPYGREMADAAWASLLQGYPQAAGVTRGDDATLREVVVEGVALEGIRERERERERLRAVAGEFVEVPGGCFQMGDTFGDGDSDEKPVHEVCVSDLQIGKYEVTQAQWRQVMGSNPSRFSGCDDCPVEQVSWNDVQDYLRRLNQQTGKTFRLPTEAEWEYAARSGGRKQKYAGGDHVDAVAWYSSNSGGRTHPVGQKQPNGLGLYDMSGNVYEWCQDSWDSGFYAKSPRNNPEASGGTNRVARSVRASYRNYFDPGYRFNYLGFRLALPPVR